MAASSPEQAVANARAVGSYDTGMCLKYVRDPCWRVPSVFASAIEAWDGAKYQHPGDRTPPKGAPMFYRGGNYGHAVIWCGSEIRSTDCTGAYDVSEVPISWVESHWGYTYLGWTEDINGVRVIPGEDDEVSKQDVIDALNSEAGQAAIRNAIWQWETTRADNGDPITYGNTVRYTLANTGKIVKQTD